MDCDTGISHLHGNIVRGMVYTTDTVASCCTGWPGLSLLMNTSVMASPQGCRQSACFADVTGFVICEQAAGVHVIDDLKEPARAAVQCHRRAAI